MTEPDAYLQCRCGACRMTLCDPVMRACTECLCFDCRQRGLISASKGLDNSLPDAVEKYERGLDLVYFSNAFIVEDASRNLLEFFKLTEEGLNTTAISVCCGTIMCGIHPMYEGTTISVNADNCRVITSSSIPSQVVVFACDAPKEAAKAIVDNREVPVIFAVYEELDHPAMAALVGAVTKPISERASTLATTNFEELCASQPLNINSAFFSESRAKYA